MIVEDPAIVVKRILGRDLWPGGFACRRKYTVWWFTGTLAGVSEGGVKVKAVVTYLTPGYPIPQIHILTGPEHEVEVRGFVDVRLDDVGEWGMTGRHFLVASGGPSAVPPASSPQYPPSVQGLLA